MTGSPLRPGGAEHHGEAELRADIDVGGAELFAEQVGPCRERRLQRRQHVVVAAPADRGFALDLGPLHHLVEQCRLEAAGAEEQPAIIGAARRLAGRRRQPGLREGVGKIGDDRRRLGHHRAAMLDRRQLAHRIERQESRRLVLVLGEIDRHDAMWRAGLLDHPAHHLRARLGIMIEDDLVGHCRSWLRLGRQAAPRCVNSLVLDRTFFPTPASRPVSDRSARSFAALEVCDVLIGWVQKSIRLWERGSPEPLFLRIVTSHERSEAALPADRHA